MQIYRYLFLPPFIYVYLIQKEESNFEKAGGLVTRNISTFRL